jgi:hypothetical protein
MSVLRYHINGGLKYNIASYPWSNCLIFAYSCWLGSRPLLGLLGQRFNFCSDSSMQRLVKALHH